MQLPEITYLGKPWQDPELLDIITAINQHDSIIFDTQACVSAFERVLERTEGENIVLSEEVFTSSTNADRGLIAQRLKDVFAPDTIVICIRNQLTALPSAYARDVLKRASDYQEFHSWIK